VTITLKEATLPERRELFRQLKFHRLMGEVSERPGRLTVALSGPLGIFDQAATYGMRLATFFPHVLHLPRWELAAEVHIKDRDLTLALDESSGLVSHYRQHRPYIPEDLLTFIDAFNERTKGWRAEPGAEFVHIGRESYCFPDLTMTGEGGRRVQVELFHRWHAGQLRRRLQALDSSEVSGLRLGVSKNLAKSADVGTLLRDSPWFSRYGFIFSQFPTPRAVAALLGD
jgi:predicted nuclease of restriction endonuclease-like RecB superfamily